MKETINVSIGNQAFTLDVDAHKLLKNYLDEVNNNIPNGDRESIFDIESRISEIVREKLPSPMMVVTVEVVRDVMEIMGAPSDFTETPNQNNKNTESQEKDKPQKKLYRSREDSRLGGVCGGLAEYFGLDVAPVRMGALVLLLIGIAPPIYIIMCIAIPLEPQKLNQ